MRRILLLLILVIAAVSCNRETTDSRPEVTLQAADTAMLPVDQHPDSLIEDVIGKVPGAEADTAAFDQPQETGQGGNNNVKDILKLLSPGKLIYSLIVFLLGFIVIRFVSGILERFAERSVQYRITIKSLVPVIRIFGWIFIMVVIIGGIIQPPMTTIITVSASVAIAVGFAAQDILKNMFGGIMILFDRPFQVGDKIEINDYYGEVVEIGLRSTRIVTPGDSLVSVPNGEIMNRPVSNANNGEANCQVEAEIFLPLTAETQHIRQVAIEAAQVSRFIYLNKPIVVLFDNVMTEERSVLKMRVKAYVSDIRNEMPFKSDMTEIIIRELLKQHLIDPEELR